jgi:quercetin dioxygenase-like cupin family protein
MRRTLLVIAIGFCAGFGGLGLAHDDEHSKGKPEVKVLSTAAVSEKMSPHRHPGPVFGYVFEGEYEWAIDDNKARVLKAGDTFYEPTGCLHRVSKNPSDKNKTRVLAVVLHPHDVKDIVIPEKKKD